MAHRPAADRFRISDQDDRGVLLLFTQYSVCLVFGHQASVLTYAASEPVEVFDPDRNEFYVFGRDTEEPYVGCMRCLAEVDLPLPPPVPVDIVDWH